LPGLKIIAGYEKLSWAELGGNMFPNHPAKENESLQKYQDGVLTTNIGSVMRFFLNLTLLLTIENTIIIIMTISPLTTEIILIALIPIVNSTFFFIIFLLLLKRVEESAASRRNIDLVSRAIWELNKSLFIRLIIGKTSTFIEEN
jgi:hypothetical protein